jgi:hypothetical protein
VPVPVRFTRQLNLILYDKRTSKPVAAFLQRPND